jgi:hypothetical protein
MAAAPVSLDQGPPLPQQLQPPQQASAAQMVGPQQTPQGLPPSASLMGNVVAQAMSIEQDLLPKIEQALINLGTSMAGGDAVVQPLLAQLNAFTNALRKQVGTAVAKGVEAPAASSFGGTGASSLLLPGGAPTS